MDVEYRGGAVSMLTLCKSKRCTSNDTNAISALSNMLTQDRSTNIIVSFTSHPHATCINFYTRMPLTWHTTQHNSRVPRTNLVNWNLIAKRGGIGGK